MNINRIVITLLIPIVICFVAWLGGWNFERGHGAFVIGTVSIVLMILVWLEQR
jgi:hypothetical protein